MESKIAAAYIRVSTDDQVEYSPDAQLAEIKKYASTHGYMLPEELIFQDDGISGKRADKRPEFNRMIGVAKQKPKPFDAILLWKFSRFARNREDSIVYKSMLRRQLGIDVVSISEPLADDKMSIILEAMIEAMDEYYSINLAEEVKRGMTEKARRGELQTTPAFGYRVGEKSLVEDPMEADVVRLIFERFKSGDSVLKITRDLGAMGVRTSRGNRFYTGAVRYILQNPVYIGKLRWNPHGKTGRNFSSEDVIISESSHNAIVSMDLWESTQNRFAVSKEMYPPHKSHGDIKSWLSGVVKCGRCGKAMISSPPGWLRCCGYVHGTCQTSQRTSDAKMRDMIISAMEEDVKNGFSVERVRVNRKSGASKVSALESQQRQLESRIQRLRDAYLAGVESLESYMAGKNAMEDHLLSIKKSLRELTAPVDAKEIACEVLECIAAVKDESISNEKRNKIVHEVIDKCLYDKETESLAVHYRISI